MDFSTVFKVLNYVVMVIGALMILTVVLAVAGVGFLSAGTDDVTQGGLTFFTLFFSLPVIGVGVVSFLAGHAGLHSDPDSCRKCSKIMAVLMVLSAVAALRNGTFNFVTVLELAIYGFYCYLAHTQYY